MRLDKFLKISRIIKRRTIAKEVTDQGRVLINGNSAKASTTVKEGDVLTIRFGQRQVTYKIRSIKETAKKEESIGMYELVSEDSTSNSN